jgi:hypothetical protein
MGDGGKFEISTVRKKYCVLGRLELARQNKNLLYLHDKPSELIKGGSLSFVLFESPFTSVSTVSRGQPWACTPTLSKLGQKTQALNIRKKVAISSLLYSLVCYLLYGRITFAGLAEFVHKDCILTLD